MVLAVALGGVVGCAGRAPVAVPAAEAVVTEGEGVDPAFAAGRGILEGFDLAPGTDEWRVGDKVLLAIRGKKSGVETVRFLLIELTDQIDDGDLVSFSAQPKGRPQYEFSSRAVFTNLTLFDQSGAVMTETKGRFPKRLLGYGLFDGVESSVDHPEMQGKDDMTSGLSDAEYDRTMRGWLTMFSFSGSMGKKGMFRDMLFDIIARPTWLEMLLNPSVSLGFGGDDWPRRGDGVKLDGAKLDTIEVPLVCQISGKRAAVARVVAARPVAPLSLCGGVVSVMAKNADDAGVTLEVRLLAAKRGNGGREFGGR
jgi:hypothetical protein